MQLSVTFHSSSVPKTVAYCTPYNAFICESAADNWEAGVCCVHVDEKTKERQTMEGTVGADGTDVASTGGRGRVRVSIIIITLQHCNTIVYM